VHRSLDCVARDRNNLVVKVEAWLSSVVEGRNDDASPSNIYDIAALRVLLSNVLSSFASQGCMLTFNASILKIYK
jgi:hypothetical protein